VRKVHDYLTICAPAPFQAAGITALGMPEAFYSGLREEYAFRRAILLDALRAAGLAYRQPEGAYYVMVDFGGLDWDARKYARAEWSLDRVFAEHMAREVGVAVVPGSSFYYQRGGDGAGTSFRTSFDAAGRGGDGRPSFDAAGRGGEMRVRINFAKREDTLREAARRLKKLEA
jgi:aminotransferase